MNDIVAAVERTLNSFERRLGVTAVVYDFMGELVSYLSPSRGIHRNAYCRALIHRDGGVRCGQFDRFISVPELLRKQEVSFFKHCHGNLLEYVQGLWRGQELHGAILLGPFQWPETLKVPGPILSQESSRKAEHCQNALFRELPKVGPEDLEDLPILAQALADTLLRIIPVSSPVSRTDRRRRWIIEDFLARRFAFPETSLADLSLVMGLSEDRSRHVVTELYGQNFMDLLTTLRLRHAKHLLRSTNMTVTQLAEHCGYADSHHFHRIFRKAFGRTPLEFRHNPSDEEMSAKVDH